MTAKESKAVVVVIGEYRPLGCKPQLIVSCDVWRVPDGTRFVEESALHAAEAELGELRRRVVSALDLLAEGDDWEAIELLRTLLASDGGADGTNTNEGKL